MCQRCKTAVPPLREALKAIGAVSVPVAEKLLEQAQSMQPKSEKKPNKTQKLWELKAQYHCPLIGTCLTVPELLKLARQANLKFEDDTDYDIHSYFVGQAEQCSHLTRKVQKFLDKKFNRQIKQFAKAKSAEELIEIWDETWQRGEVAGAFWALMTHPLADKPIQHAAYAQVHMLSHQIGSTKTADMRKQHQLEQQQADLQEQLKQTRQGVLERDQKIQDLHKQLQHLELQNKQVQPMACQDTEVLEQELRRYKQTLEHVQTRLDVAQETVQQQNLRIAELEAALQCEQIERRALEKQLEQMLAPEECQQCTKDTEAQAWCAQQNLEGRCILYVGGRDKLKPHFRNLVESYGGNFIHHDGGLHGKDHHLQQVLCQADTVFCPLDCISHNACQAIKTFCKKHNKTMVLLRTESLSAFSRGLQDTLVKAA